MDTAPLIGRRLCGLVFFGVQIDDRFRKFGQRGVRGTFLVEGLQQLRRLRVTEFFGRARRDRWTVRLCQTRTEMSRAGGLFDAEEARKERQLCGDTLRQGISKRPASAGRFLRRLRMS